LRLTVSLLLLILSALLFCDEFDLFDERDAVDESLFRDHKFNRIVSSYSLLPSEYKAPAVSFSHYFNRKIGFIFETAISESGDSFKEKADFTGGITYRFTKRARTWIFTGDLGFSVNDDVKDYYGISKGFRLNHFTGRFNIEYIFSNNIGFCYSMKGRIPIEFDLDEDVSPIHSAGLIFQF